MRDEIIDILTRSLEIEYWNSKTSIEEVAEEIEKLYENKETLTSVVPGAQAAIEAGLNLVKHLR